MNSCFLSMFCIYQFIKNNIFTLHYTKEQMRLLFSAKSGMIASGFVFPIIIFFIYKGQIDFHLLAIWVILQMATFFLRWYINHKAEMLPPKEDIALYYKYLKWYLFTVFINSFLWGLLSLPIFMYTSETYILFYFILLCGMASASVATLGMILHAVYIFVISIILTTIIALVFIGSTKLYFVMGIMFLFYLIIMLLASYKMYETMRKNIQQKYEIEKSHNLINDSINYAALIQSSILPDENILRNFCLDSFVYWKPKDTVGGDIYFIRQITPDEVIIMIIDGAGHGVPGAFLTMLFKAIEERIAAEIKSGILTPDPGELLSYFNKSIKIMLRQEKRSSSNAGFDGAILYYNKKTNQCKFAGAKTPLYIINDGKMEVIKSDRKSVGFSRTKIEQTYTQHEVSIKKGTKLYITTDGILDQEGKDGDRFGKKRFEKLILDICDKPFNEQSSVIQKQLSKFEGTCQQSDDITITGFEFC